MSASEPPRTAAGIAMIAVGFALMSLGLASGQQGAFIGSGVTFVIVGAALWRRGRLRGRAEPTRG